MPTINLLFRSAALVLATLSLASGCQIGHAWKYYNPAHPKTLGTDVDQYNEPQEHNAEAAKYIIYQHEFELNEWRDGRHVGGVRLNDAGQDHVKKIAHNLRRGAMYQVVIERSRTSVKPGTQYEYPVHLNPELDMKRRTVVVRALTAMGIPNADDLVVVAPSFAQPYTGGEAESAYRRGLGRQGFGNNSGFGFGGAFGGFGGGFGGIF